MLYKLEKQEKTALEEVRNKNSISEPAELLTSQLFSSRQLSKLRIMGGKRAMKKSSEGINKNVFTCRLGTEFIVIVYTPFHNNPSFA